ncbi:MAG: VOC family protein [Bacteroidota bacterium]|uniref:VOC family protein n=1 Tax=Flagellimonas okinawensis TaxID=3031324 RepID=A0ABT5XT07_9FLAO|nr:VOC family protein [[Muricauda] okinawensis]MDF0708716.1 VOC family protein [[Muricauda] okinawensis]MEC8832523.1 VOC family protein [Bacteroidota bacterium]
MNAPIDYIEFKATNLEKTKRFYGQTFGWTFTDYGPSYTSFSESGVAGGFELSPEPIVNGTLIVLYYSDLVGIREKVIAAGGEISKEIFEFPGGKRFHFTDPSGNELAIWSE